ncbi:MAG: phosphonopyruvate decarboxylase [Spirochaetaceae bacterium]|jgi:phosphonopyruvate decarboxylase|nr:phosphonopyruvate decarboxylase [Spirochaetaceae bacterium]
MLDTVRFGELLQRRGYNFYSGVPCSFLKDLINYSINECDYVMAANEGDAAAICAGAYLGNRKPVLLMQNSGLGNAVSPLTSLHGVFRIPLLGFVSLRGGPADEPQHELMGPITAPMLETMGIAHETLGGTIEEAETQLARADQAFSRGQSFFFIVTKGTFSPVALRKSPGPPAGTAPRGDIPVLPQERTGEEPFTGETLFTRREMLASLRAAAAPGSAILATTGFTGRELYELGDGPENLYMAGSLGCVSSLGLGLALARPDRRVIVLDGDGSLLMRTGALAVNGWYNPGRMLHILFDNRAHESTGGQFTVSAGVDWPAAVRALGYPWVRRAASPGALEQETASWNKAGGLRFIHVPIALGTPENLGRPKINPRDGAIRFKEYLSKPPIIA